MAKAGRRQLYVQPTLPLPVTSNIAFNQGQAQLSQVQNILVQPHDLRRDQERQRDTEWRRISHGGAPIVVPPSPALVRHGSKRKPNAGTSAGTPGQVTPLSAAAQVNVPVSTPQNRASHIGAPPHPYASAAPGTDYPRESNGDPYTAQPYARASPMISTVAPPAISNFRAQGNEVGASHGEEYREQDGQGPQPKSTFWRVLTCRCC